MSDVQDNHFIRRDIDGVENQEGIAHHGDDTDAVLIGQMPDVWELSEKFGEPLNHFHDSRGSGSMMRRNVCENLVNFNERGLGLADLHAR